MAGLCGSATECTTYGREISARWIDRNCCELALRARRAFGGSVTDPSRGIGNRNNGFTRMNSPAKSREAQTGCSSERASSLPDARVIRLNIRALSSRRLLRRSSSQRLATQARCTPGLAVLVGRSRNRACDGGSQYETQRHRSFKTARRPDSYSGRCKRNRGGCVVRRQ
jgi:hypothetical protein